MTNAIFDLSNMFFRSMFIVGGYGKKQYTFDSEKETSQLMRKVAMDISSVIRVINPSRIIFTLDSRSWRKDISIDENEGYKGHRKKAEHINWDNVYQIMDEFAEIMKTNDFIVSKIENAEADDLMALWRDELLKNKNQHVILVSADEDVRQLVDSLQYTSDSNSTKKAFSVVYNPFTQGKNSSRKLFVPVGFNEWLDDTDDIGDIFNRSIDVDKEDFRRIINEKVKIEEVLGSEIALKKVFCGDDGDNVPSIFSWISTTNTGKEREVRITPAKYKKIIETTGINHFDQLMKKSDSIKDQILEISDKKKLPFDIKKRLQRQIELVVLNPEVFPKQIVEDFKEDINRDMAKPHAHPQSWNMKSMLEGTKYVDNNHTSNSSEASIFNQIDKISNKELF
jgi:hypothetical protein